MTKKTIQRIEKRPDGFHVRCTDDSVLVLYIDPDQGCCENAGFFLSEDDLGAFRYAQLLAVTITDTELKTGSLEERVDGGLEGLDEGGVMFVNLHTTEGVVQFTAYNAHNGYYGHTAKVYWLEPNVLHEKVL